MPKQPSNDEQRRNVDKKIAHATRPAMAYLAITEPFRDEGEWVFLGCTINDSNDGGSFNQGGTYIEAYLMRQIIVARLRAGGVLVESFVAKRGDEHYLRTAKLRDRLHREPDAPPVAPRRERIRDYAAALQFSQLDRGQTVRVTTGIDVKSQSILCDQSRNYFSDKAPGTPS